ncbi:MAG: insulinase family protein, partial [Lachnospiraceae bacterium]|nr:insulinase family protein [Lachnospiraceae bacterium]
MEQYKGYELISEQEISIGSFKTTGKVLRHVKTGAKVALLENDDENKVFYIGFRTPPTDSTGVAHITEHSVLCGSEKFPLKDPFVELVKGSLNTFLNAITYSDKTVYPIASCNDQDFQNLMDVYLDAVFHPNTYKKKAIFLQEGWHYEFDEDGKLSYNGVVYNEMKGAFSNADEIFYREITSSLYPDTPYAVESGGAPENIPDLTYEDFLAFHSKYYHPSNSYIYLYGNMDMAEKLEFIDREYLSKYDALEVDSRIAMQKAPEKPVRVELEYPIDEEEDAKEKAYLSVHYSIGTSLDPIAYVAYQVIARVILNQNGTPLKQALLDAGLGKDVYGIYENGIQQPFFSIVAKDADESREEEFLSIVENTLKKIVSEGIDKKALRSSLNTFEFRYLEADYGRYPKGLMYGLQALDSWLYDDEKPFIHVDANETLAFLRKMVDTNYYEELIKKGLIENKHKSILVLKPKAGLLEEQEKALEEKLEKIREGMSEADMERIKADNEALKAFQDREDTQEELDTIPVLKREDLKKEAQKLYNEPMTVDGTEYLYHDIFSNGVGYLNLSFKLDEIPEEYFPYLGLLRMVLFELSTENYSYGELVKEIGLVAGGMASDTNIVKMEHELDSCKIYMMLNAKFLYENLEKVMD